jgi:GntR family transcriptional regulator / MocR family aminotransferase
VRGIAAGLHVTVELPAGHDPEAIRAEAERRRIALSTLADYRTERSWPPVLLLGYGQVAAAAVPAGVRELAAAVRAAEA